MRNKRTRSTLRVFLVAALIAPLQVFLGAAPASAAGIQCADIGNGLLCVNVYSSDRIDVWYDKHAGVPVGVELGYHFNKPGPSGVVPVMDTNNFRTVSAGERAFSSIFRYASDGNCYAPRLVAYELPLPDDVPLDNIIIGNWNCA